MMKDELAMTSSKQTKLHLGCGKKKIHGWINVDVNPECDPDVIMDISNISSKWNNEADIIYSCHVLEHLPRKTFEGQEKTYMDVLQDWHKALKPNGILRLSVPDFGAICKHYCKFGSIEKFYGLILGGQKNKWDIHYHIFDFQSLEKDLKHIGFRQVKNYDRWDTEHSFIDDYSAATLFPAFSRDGLLMSLNVAATK